MVGGSHLIARLDAIRSTEKFDSATIDRFAQFISAAPDDELFHMSPLRYADRTETSRQVAVNLFLHATHVGILDFNWGVLCPSCGAFLTKQSGLRWLRDRKRCALCRLDTAPSVDEQIEVAFTVSPSVRPIRFHSPEGLAFERDGFFTFFSTSISLHPEVHKIVHSSLQSSHRVPASSTRQITLDFEPNHYLLMAPASHGVAHIPVTDDVATHEVELDIVFDGQLVPEIAGMGPGAGVIQINNRTKQAVQLGLLRDSRLAPTPPEQRTGSLYTLTPYLTGKELISLQSFRDLFRAESIPPAGGLEVRNLTLLFTDLNGSTPMYERIGDFNAYAVVREHFALLRGIVAARDGAIVKTMGDAIMASFPSPASALEAAAVMRREAQRMTSGEELILKIGLHCGPCIAVENNEQLDYFGHAVNVAARVQSAAEAGEIVCTEAVYNAPDVVAAAKRAGLRPTRDTALLRGVGEPVTFYRLR